ncbi:MAG: MFS transporter [Mycobacteriaceae bacterium]|uniref:MFS transporter n=1 Tax=Corynebacterium sp. TaxID=1720 RepID=UPI003F96D749
MAITGGTARQLWTGALVLAVLSAAANMASPLYPAFQNLHGMSDTTMTMLYATFALTSVASLLVFGSAADSLGRRPVLIAGIIVTALGTAFFAVDLGGTPGLFLGRVLLGVGLGLGTGAGMALTVEAAPLSRPWLGSTLGTVAFVAGTGAGPGMAGVVSAAMGGSLMVPFLIMLVLLAGSAAAVLALPRHRPVIRQRWRPAWPTVPTPMRATFAVAAATGFLGWCAVGVFLALLPSTAEQVLGHPDTAASGLLVAAVLFISAACQFAAPKLDPRTAQTLGLTGLALGTVLLLISNLPFLGGPGSLVVMAVAAVVTGIGHGLSYWGANQETDLLTPAPHRAGVTAALYLAFYGGSGLPAVAVGVLTMNAPMSTAVPVFSMVLALCIIAFLPVPGLVRRGSPTVTEPQTAQSPASYGIVH